MRAAAIDLGSNSCRLFIADKESSGLKEICRQLETSRIGEGVNASGIINEDAAERTINCLKTFRQSMEDKQVQIYRAVATSAVREAANGKEFVQMVLDRTGLKIDIIDGEEEARLSYLGVKKGLNLNSPLVVDLGGGSTEFICVDKDFMISIPLGAVRASEAKWGPEQISELLAPIQANKELFTNCPLVFVGGTASTMAAVKLSLDVFDSTRVHGQRLDIGEIEDLYDMLHKMPLRLRQRLAGLQPERADIIDSGALIMLMIIKTLEKEELIVSETDLMQGIIWSFQ